MTIQSGVVSQWQPGSSEYALNQGTGHRSADAYVKFPTEFGQNPTIVVSIVSLNVPADKPTIITVSAKDITKVGFNLQFQTSGESIISGVSASWIAYTQ